MLSYCFPLKSYYINKRLSLKGLNNLWMAFGIKSIKRLFYNKNQNCMLITKDIFNKLVKISPYLL